MNLLSIFRRLSARIVGALAASLCTAAIAGDAWHSFQNGGAVSLRDGFTERPTLSEEIGWQVELAGYGQSSPVVWDGHVYVTSVEGPNKETFHVTAYRLENGEQLWQHDVVNASPQENNNYVSRAAPTPAVDEDGVVCFFEGGNVVALNHQGDLRWERNLVEDYGDVAARHGLAASVEQDDRAAYVWVERSQQPYVLSLDKATGETVWKVEGIGTTSWASPRLVPVAGGPHLVLSGVGSLVGLSTVSGERLWSIDGVSGNSTPTPIPLGDGRFLIGATVGREEADSGNAAASNGVVSISRTGDGGWQADYVWRAERATSSFGSPIAHNGLAYFVNRAGVVFGLDLESGDEKFAERLDGSTWATPLGVGNRVFFFGRDGRINVLAGHESPEMNTWDELPPDSAPGGGPFSGSVLYAASWTGDTMLLRRGDRLFAVQTSNAN